MGATPYMTTPNDDGNVRDFSRRRQVRFRVDRGDGTPEYFDGVPGLPALTLAEFAATADQLGEDLTVPQQVETFTNLFRLILTGESADRFVDRLADPANPIGIDQVNDILPYVMGEYGMRPTQPSSPSSIGSGNPDGSRNSTDVARPTGLMFEDSPQTVSST